MTYMCISFPIRSSFRVRSFHERPGMTKRQSRDSRLALRRACATRQQAGLDRLDLQREIFRIDPALCQAAGDEPEAGLPGARVHVAQLLVLAESPDPAHTPGALSPE